jgi:NAD(P)-dependent dehydrogenase (short-subunit alcohol dehydrogenase family)
MRTERVSARRPRTGVHSVLDPQSSILPGRVAIVTGGSRGIGLAISRALAEAGARVVIANRDAARGARAASGLRAAGLEAVAIPVDVTERHSVQALVDAVMQRFRRVDILVNNAGVHVRKETEDVTDEEWERLMGVNVTGTFLCSQIVGRHMIRRRRGVIVNVASMGAAIQLSRGTAYCATKAAVAQFSSALACEWGRFGVRVNAVAPGAVHTAMSEEIWNDPVRRRFNSQQAPLGRWGRPVDVAAAVLYLASDQAAYVTGHILYVDGGRTKW